MADESGVRLEIAFDFLLQRIDEARNGDEHGDALAVDGGHDLGRIERIFKDDSRAQKRRQKNSEELSEDVAQREKIQKAYGMKPALIL